MGQYHNVINIDKQMQYNPRSLGCGMKLLEQGNDLASTTALALLLSQGWNGERVALVGDYVEKNDLSGIDDAVELYAHADKAYKNVGWLARKVVQDAIGLNFFKDHYYIGSAKHSFYDISLPKNLVVSYPTVSGAALDDFDNTEIMAFVNYDTKEKYVGNGRTMRNVIENFAGDFMTAVFILLAGSIRGGARGGGDADNKMGGAWSGNRVGIIPNKDAHDFTDITDKVGDVSNL